MHDQGKYLIFKIILRSFATGCVIMGWMAKGSAWGGAAFWTGIVITVVSFFL
ncbi:MAG: hypothetical protein JW919_06170 [Candidatus Omnitrophica bacterium]|nr:hypothetical protein [Candidatus Omnitrophota bacterium]